MIPWSKAAKMDKKALGDSVVQLLQFKGNPPAGIW